MTTLLLIRHAENEYVKTGRLAGQTPGVHLNERGREQAAEVSLRLRDAPIRAVYSSPMERAQETAAPLAEALGLPVLPAPGLVEVNFGDWQGRSIKQLRRLKLWQTVQNRPSAMRFPNGESFVEAQERAVRQSLEIAAAHPEETVACFSHGDVIRLAAAHFLDMPLDSFQRLGCELISLTIVHIGKDGRCAVQSVNQRFHLTWPEKKEAPTKK